MVISGTKYWHLVPACLSHLLAQVCKESDLALALAVAMLMIFPFFKFLAYLGPIFASLLASSLCAMPLWADEYVANIVTGSMDLEMYFILRLVVWGDYGIYCSSDVAKYADIIEGPWSWERCNVLSAKKQCLHFTSIVC